jgi:predicted Fe-Mo cluster-binding NifX family protein
MKKIAFPTEDGETISRHMGEARFFMVAILDDAGTVSFEKRDKPFRDSGVKPGQHEPMHNGLGRTMFLPISDCQVLISGGMGDLAYKHAREQGLEIILPAEKNIQIALDAYRRGNLNSDPRRIHKH